MNIIEQTKTLAEKTNQIENWVDLDYMGFKAGAQKNAELERSFFEKKNYKAHINRVLFWLSSKKGDFGRSNIQAGGILYELLGKLSRDTDLKAWENYIKEEFNKEFSQDLKLLLIHLDVDKSFKKLTINMIVQDLLTEMPFKVQTGVEK